MGASSKMRVILSLPVRLEQNVFEHCEQLAGWGEPSEVTAVAS